MLLGTVAQWQRETISERTREVLQHKRAQGQRTSRFAPYGFRETPDGRGWVKDRHEQAGLKLMRRLRAEGNSLRDVGSIMARRGYRGRKGQTLSAKTISKLLLREG